MPPQRRRLARRSSRLRAYRPEASIDGVLVQAMSAGKVEFVIGLKRDAVLGTVMMAGLGGVLIEVPKDVSFRRANAADRLGRLGHVPAAGQKQQTAMKRSGGDYRRQALPDAMGIR